MIRAKAMRQNFLLKPLSRKARNIIFFALFCASGMLFLFLTGLPKVAFFLAVNGVTLWWFCVSLDGISRPKRLALSYLYFSALVYFWAGLAGTGAHNELVGILIMDNSVVFPIAALVRVLQTALNSHASGLSDLRYDVVDVSGIVIICSLAAMGATKAMSWKLKSGYYVWVGFISISLIASLWYFLTNVFGGAGVTGRLIWLVACPSSYALAYWVARPQLNRTNVVHPAQTRLPNSV